MCALANRPLWRHAFQWLGIYIFLIFTKEHSMNRIVYLVGAVVIIIALLSFFGLR